MKTTLRTTTQYTGDVMDWQTVECPYCGERFETAVDTSAGDQQYIEDCQVCCRPIVFRLETDLDGTLRALTTTRDDD